MIYEKNKVTIFPCEHEFDISVITPGRCVVCKMPIKSNEKQIFEFNTTMEFCCMDCKGYYLEYLLDINNAKGEQK